MGINSNSDRAASLVIGPTSLGMVRIYVESDGVELPMDFGPAEALEIADELRAAAERAAAMAGGQAAPKKSEKSEKPKKRPNKGASRTGGGSGG